MNANALVASLESAKARALLAYLGVEIAEPHRCGSLVGLPLPDRDEEVARRNLRQALYNVCQAIGNASADPP